MTRFRMAPPSFIVLLALAALLALPSLLLAQGESTLSPEEAALATSIIGGSFAVICAIIVVTLIINIIILIWVYRDAQARNGNGAIWALLVFFTGVVGLIVYVLLGRNNTNPVTN
jgi:heme/copper-type cytochrome/quinol oxidase subunit 2